MPEIKNTVTLTINGKEVTVPRGSTIMDATRQMGIEIPHFCYHPRLSVAGNCRMCLVEIEGGPPKPQASCAMPAADGMVVHTESEMVKKARKNVMELMLVNHPLDCPICDQGGECGLQDQAVAYGSDMTGFNEAKRAVEDKDIGAKIKTVMTRCIHCMRCVRFATEVAGVEEFGATGRGEGTKVGTYIAKALQSELAGNMIDLCPVGALTSKPYAFTARPWELKRTPSIDVMDGLGSHIEIHSRSTGEHPNGEVMRIVPRECDSINEEWISDAARFSYDGLKTNRLLHPAVKKGRSKIQSKATWQQAFEAVQKAVKKGGEIAAVANGPHSAEDLYAFNAFMKGVVDTPHVDGRPLNWGVYENASRASYTFSSHITAIDEADAILLIGSNPRLEAAVLNARIGSKVRRKGVKVGLIGEAVDLSYPYEHIGGNISDISSLTKGKTGFAKTLKEAKSPLIIIGAAALCRADAGILLSEVCKLAEKISVRNEDCSGVNVLHSTPSAVTALDLHVQPEEGAWSKAEIAKQLQAGKVETLFVYGESEIPEETLKKAKFIVYVGTHNTPQAKLADVVLPVAAYTEKTALWTNTEGLVQEAEKAVEAPGEAKEDWKVFRAMSEVFKHPMAFDNKTTLRQIISEKNVAYKRVGAHVVPPPCTSCLKSGKPLKAPLLNAGVDFYAHNEILRNSSVMAQCKAEGAFEIKVKKAG